MNDIWRCGLGFIFHYKIFLSIISPLHYVAEHLRCVQEKLLYRHLNRRFLLSSLASLAQPEMGVGLRLRLAKCTNKSWPLNCKMYQKSGTCYQTKDSWSYFVSERKWDQCDCVTLVTHLLLIKIDFMKSWQMWL